MKKETQETLDIKLAPDQTSVQLIGSFSWGGIELPKTIDELLRLCEQAMHKYYERHGEYQLTLDFQATTKISSVGFSILEADVQEFVQKKEAKLKFVNFPMFFKPSLETRALYYRLSEQDGVHFRD
jgi:anti-anti-sigma regulatory factor